MGASDGPMILPKVTRVEVIDNTGRAFVAHYASVGVTVHVQDDGRTVKVFAGAREENPKWR